MTTENDYYSWLKSKIDDADFNPSHYELLLSRLYHTEFTWTFEDDQARASDGMALRERYAKETSQDPLTVRMWLNFPCTMLEMMIALASRCENQLMEDLFVGNRTGRWFKVMITSLGLAWEYDDLYNESYVTYILNSFLDHDYGRNGDGGLFKIDNANVNLREMGIWYQMNLYLCNLLEAN